MNERETTAEYAARLRRETEDADEPAGLSIPTRPDRPIPGLLVPLSHAMTEDARADLARVSPARWRLRVHMHDEEAWAQAIADGSAPDRGDEDDELAGYVCVQRAMPVAHCTPDVLSWLSARGFIGALVLEWLPPPEAKSKRMRHFVHIPDSGSSTSKGPSAPVMRPEHRDARDHRDGRDDLVERLIEQMREDSAALRQLFKESLDTQASVVEKLGEAHTQALERVRRGYEEQLRDDPLRQVGRTLHEQTQAKLIEQLGSEKDPLEKLIEQVKRVEEVRGKLSSIADPELRDKINPLEEKMGNALTDLAVAWGKQKLGLPAVSGEQALNLTRSLAELERDGQGLLDSLDDEAA
jgi:hypothetical protein